MDKEKSGKFHSFTIEVREKAGHFNQKSQEGKTIKSWEFYNEVQCSSCFDLNLNVYF